MTNNYETVLLVSVADGEEKVRAIVEKFKALIEANGTLVKTDEWGRRRLAYAIDYQAEGYYVVFSFTGEAEFPAELARVANITEGVLRLQTVKKAKLEAPVEEKAEEPAEKPEAVAEETEEKDA